MRRLLQKEGPEVRPVVRKERGGSLAARGKRSIFPERVACSQSKLIGFNNSHFSFVSASFSFQFKVVKMSYIQILKTGGVFS